MAVQIQIRRDSAADWSSNNPTMAEGELGYDTTSSGLKIGDGSTAWNDLSYLSTGGSGVSDHGLLSGLADDDHSQYTLADGTRAFTGNIQSSTSGTLSIGSITNPFKDLYLTGASLYIDGNEVIFLENNELVLQSPNGGPVTITTSGGDAFTTNIEGDVKLRLGSQYVNEFSTDGTLSGDSDTAIPTEQAVKTYVDNAVITDHGLLTGLEDDDHPQYITESEMTTISGDLLDQMTTISGAVITDHGLLSGLDDNDHPQYTLVNGSSGFTSTVSGVDPTESYHLTTKSYVDSSIATASGDIVSQIPSDYISDSEMTTISGDLQTNIEALTHDGFADYVSAEHFTEASIDHGSIGGRDDDDHTQYILADGSRAFTGSIQASTSGTLDIGSIDNPFRNVYLTGASVFINEYEVIYLVGNGLVLESPEGNPITLTTAGGDALITDSSAGIKLNVGSQYVNEFSTDGTFAGDSDTAIPTEKAVKTYVDNSATTVSGDIQVVIDALTHDGFADYVAAEHFTEGSIDHGSIGGLSDDDHSQYLLADGTRHVATLVIDGDLVVSGTQFTANTETVLIEDNLLVINNGEVGAGVTLGVAGIEVDRGTLPNYQFYFDETFDNFQVGQSGSLQPVATRLDSASMTASGVPYWDDGNDRFLTTAGFIFSAGNVSVPAAVPTAISHLTRKDYVDGEVSSHTHVEANITDLDRYTQAEVDTISGAISTEIDGDITTHSASADHDGRYYTEAELNAGQLDGRYYMESEVDTISGAISSEIDGDISTHSASADHDGRYYTESEVDALTWTESDITDLDKYTQTEVDTLLTTLSGNMDHGGLGGLSDDDHTQYLLADGTRALTGTWSFGAQDISGSGDILTTGDMGVGTSGPIARLEVEDGGTGNQILLKVTQDDQGVEGIVVSNDTYSTNDLLGINIRQRNSGESVIGNAANNTIVMDISGGVRFSVGSQFVNEFSTDGALAGDSNIAVPTEQAVKTYVDALTHDGFADFAANEHFTFASVSGTIDHNTIVNNHNLTTDIDHDQLTNFAANEHFTEASIDHDNITNTHNLTTDINHDALTNFAANEHVVWTADAGASNIHDNNIVASSITQHVASINHDSLLNNHNLTTDINHDALTNFVSNEHINWIADAGANDIHDNNIVASSITQHVASIDHDSLLNFTANEHFTEASIDHGSISGLSDDDHPQYMLSASGISDDTSPELGGDLTLGDYSIVINTSPSTTGWSGDISTMTVDLNDNGIGTPLHMKTNGNWEQCTAASGTTRIPCTAIALETGTGSNKKILWKGIITKGAWSWTAGDIIYVSTVEGALTNTQPTSTGDIVQPLGVAIASDTVRFDPGLLWVEVE